MRCDHAFLDEVIKKFLGIFKWHDVLKIHIVSCSAAERKNGVSHSCVHKESSVGERTQWMILKKSGFIIIHMCVHVRVHVIVVVFFFCYNLMKSIKPLVKQHIRKKYDEGFRFIDFFGLLSENDVNWQLFFLKKILNRTVKKIGGHECI